MDKENPLEAISRFDDASKLPDEIWDLIRQFNSNTLKLLSKDKISIVDENFRAHYYLRTKDFEGHTRGEFTGDISYILDLAGKTPALSIDLYRLIRAVLARDPGVVPLVLDTENTLTKSSSGINRNKLTEDELKIAMKKFTTREGKLNVKAIRENLGLSQNEFAKEFFIPAGSVRNWEQGISDPSDTSLFALTMIALEPEAARRAAPFLKTLHKKVIA